FQILERGAAQSRVIGMKASIGNLQRGRWQDERKQREDVRPTLSRALLQELVDERSRVAFDRVEETVAFPDRTSYCDLAPDHVEDALLVDAEPWVLLDDRGERSTTLESHLEAQVLEPEHHTVNGALSHTTL